MALDPLNDPFLKQFIEPSEHEEKTGTDPFFQSIGVTPPTGFYDTVQPESEPEGFWEGLANKVGGIKPDDMVPDLAPEVADFRDTYFPYLGSQVQGQAGGAQVNAPGPDMSRVPGLLKKGLVDDFYPLLQQEVGGLMMQAGAPDMVEDYKTRMGRARDTLKNPEAGTIEKSMALMALSPPGQLMRFVADTLDEQRVGVMEGTELNMGTEKAPNKVTMGELLVDMGLIAHRNAKEELNKDLPPSLSIPESAALSMGRSVGSMSKYGVLGLTNKMKAGLISTGFGVEEFARSYADKFDETGDAQLAFQHATNSGVAEKVFEQSAWKALLKPGSIKGRVLKYLALELGGENLTELWQEFSDIATSSEGQKMSVLQVLDEVVERAPRLMAITTLSTLGSSGAVGTGAIVVDKTLGAIDAYEQMKGKQSEDDLNDRARQYKAGRAAHDEAEGVFTDISGRGLVPVNGAAEVLDPIDQAFLPDVQKKLPDAQKKLEAPTSKEVAKLEKTVGKLPFIPDEPEVKFNYARADLIDALLDNNETMQEALIEAQAIADTYSAYTGDDMFGELFVKDLVSGWDKQAGDKRFVTAVRAGRASVDGAPFTFVGNHDATTYPVRTVNLLSRQHKLNAAYQKSLNEFEQLDTLNTPPEVVNAKLTAVGEAKYKYTQARKEYLTSELIFNEGQKLVEEFRKTYMPEQTLVITDKSHSQPKAVVETSTNGGSSGNYVFNLNGAKTNTIAININARTIGHLEASLSADNSTITNLSHVETVLAEVIGHEFMHAMARIVLKNSPEVIRKALLADYNKGRRAASMLRNSESATPADVKQLLYGASVINRFRRSTRDMGLTPKRWKTVTAAEVYKTWQEQKTNRRVQQYKGDKQERADYFGYVMSFDEWFAHGLEKAVIGSPYISKVTANTFTRLRGIIERFHTKERKRWNPPESIESFLKFHAAEVSYNKAMEEFDAEALAVGTENNEEESAIADILGGVFESATENNSDADNDFINNIANPRADLDKFNSFVKHMFTLDQLVQVNPHIPSLKQYFKLNQDWWARKSQWNVLATDTVEQWTNLGKDQADRLSKFVLAVTIESDNLGRKLTLEELEDLNSYKKHQLNADAFALWEKIDNDFQMALGYGEELPGGLYKVLLDDIKRVHALNPENALEAIQKLNMDMEQIVNRNFFPLSRFGRFKVTVRALHETSVDGRLIPENGIIRFDTFEDVNQRDAFAQKMDRIYTSHSIEPGTMDDTEYAFSGMPPNLLRAMQDRLDLTATQQKALDGILLEQTTAARFKKHLLNRANVPGFSLDAMRGYATYMGNLANHLARMEYAPQMSEIITELENSIATISRQNIDKKIAGRQADKRRRLVDWMKTHFDYIMNPGNELANLRSVAFIWYMGFIPKSAALNFTQLGTTTLPYLSSRKELGGSKTGAGVYAVKVMSKAIIDLGASLRKNSDSINDTESRMFDILVKRGNIDESLAQNLAMLAEGSNLQRMLPKGYGFGVLRGQTATSVIRDVSYYGAWMFHNVEKLNRRVTALSAFRMAYEDMGMSFEEAVEEASHAIDQTQFELARWNRPSFMRGKKSVVWMFKLFLQHMLFFFAYSPGGKKALLVILLLGGLSGLPFAKDAMEIFDWLARKWDKHFGEKGARVSSEEMIRELANAINVDPNIAMHGLASEYGLGPVHFVEWAGIPIPNVDLSGSLSFGDVLMFPQTLNTDDRMTAAETVGRVASDASGAIVGVPLSLYDAFTSENPDVWKRAERAAPKIISNISKMTRLAVRGEETRVDGTTLKEYNIADPFDATQLLLIGAGFADAEVAKDRRANWSKRQAFQFHATRSALIVNQEATARMKNDREGIADAVKARKNYNSTVPFPSLKIKPKAITSAVQRLKHNEQLQKRRLPLNRKNFQLNESLNELYPIEEEGVK